MQRDGRLLFAMLLFAVSLIASTLQAAIVSAYVDAAVMGNWAWFAETFSVEIPGSGPDKVCLDYCVPKLPFMVGWLGLAAFILGWLTLARAWWTRRT